MKVSLRILLLIAVTGILSLSYVSLAADKPAAPKITDRVDLGAFNAVIYTQGNSLCITLVAKVAIPNPTAPVGKCFLKAREFVFSDATIYNEGMLYAVTVDLEGRPDEECSMNLSDGGATIICPELL
jgi:hypothetical protein